MLEEALGDARPVVNVGAGTGAYEPTDREVLAIEPSQTMIAQRPRGSAPVIRARAEKLPFRDGSFDAAFGVNTLRHWDDMRAGLRELRRIARKRIVFFLRDAPGGTPFWMTEDYLPSLDTSRTSSAMVAAIEAELGRVEAIPVRLPERYLDAEVRRNISVFALATEAELAEGLERLGTDLESGSWDRTYGHLRSLPELDLGHRLLVAELP